MLANCTRKNTQNKKFNESNSDGAICLVDSELNFYNKGHGKIILYQVM